MTISARSSADFTPRAVSGIGRVCLLLLALLGMQAHAADLLGGTADAWLDDEPEFLHVDEAFILSTETGADGALRVNWDMPDGYYLYRHRFDFQTREGAQIQLGEAEIPPGKHKVDEYFGEVEVYYHNATARVPVSAASGGTAEVGIGYQGCADAGLCYPPEVKWVTIPVAASSAGLPPTGGGSAATVVDVPVSEEQQLASLLTGSSLLTALAIFFVAGLALTFTPCVLPMVPILSSIIVGESGRAGGTLSRSRALTLSVAYVLGMALTYALIGTLVGLFGASLNLQASLQAPPVLIVFAIVFVVLSLSMFGFYELRLPASWQNAINSLGDRQAGGKYLGVFIMGALSSLVVSPCVSAPLAGALIYISATEDAVLGGTALLALGLGMGTPLVLIGASGGHLLPKAGAWMDTVKAVFGVMLLAVAVWLLERVVPASVTLALWAALAIGSGVYLGALDTSARQGWGQLWKATGVFSLAWGVLLLIGAASGAEDPLRPLNKVALGGGSGGGAAVQEVEWHAVKSLADVDRELIAARNAGKPALLDLYADWCVSCKVMERSVFPEPRVEAGLRQFHLIRADVTRNDETDKALLNAYGLFGPPSLVFFAQDGSEIGEFRIQGEVGADALAPHLNAVLAQFSHDSGTQIAAK